jgi:hypothetical protein
MWQWTTFIMHELCGVRIGLVTIIASTRNKPFFGEKIPKKFAKKIKIWHLLCGIALWTMWIERNDCVFN